MAWGSSRWGSVRWSGTSGPVVITYPVVVKVTPIGVRMLEVLYSKEMDETAETTSPANYLLNHDLEVKSVSRAGKRKVLLYLNGDMVPDLQYELTVVPG